IHYRHGVSLPHFALFSRFSCFYMQLNVVLLNSLIKAINHTYDILIIRVEFDMLLLAIRSVSFWGVLGLDLLHKRNRFFCLLVLLYNTYTALSLTLYFFFYLIASLYSFVLVFFFFFVIFFFVMLIVIYFCIYLNLLCLFFFTLS